EVLAADVLEVDVDTFGHRGSNGRGQITGFAVVDRLVDAELLRKVPTLLIRTGGADDVTAVVLRNLHDDRPARAGSCGHEHALAILQLSDAKKTRISGETRHAERTQIGLDRRNRPAELRKALAARDEPLAPAVEVGDVVAGLEVPIVVRVDHLA